jgi:hypothetical protein
LLVGHTLVLINVSSATRQHLGTTSLGLAGTNTISISLAAKGFIGKEDKIK